MKNFIIIICTVLVSMSMSCKKKTDAHIPPDLAFKTGAGYTTGDVTIVHGDSILVGIIITKKEDDLRTFNISYAYDGASSPTTLLTYTMTPAEYGGWSHDYWIHSRNVAGSERWTFTVVDRDGNIAQKVITLTVQ
jgi:hypothetical protein